MAERNSNSVGRIGVDDIDEIYRQTLEDRRLSRSEKHALTELFGQQTSETLALWRHRAFAQARAHILGVEGGRSEQAISDVLEWLEDVVRALAYADRPHEPPHVAESHFSPGTRPRQRIRGLLETAERSVDICVFTITDDHLAQAIVDTHERGVSVRVVSDGAKTEDLGSDICDLARHGINVRVDASEAHMHHKFAVFDHRLLLTGSYNWTRSAAMVNQENVLVTDDRRLTDAYSAQFDRLWRSLAS